MLPIHFLVLITLLLVLSGILMGSVYAGRRYGKRHLSLHPNKPLEIVTVAEGAVFALLGLLVAFSFSGAYGRYEARKLHIIEEANAYETTYQRLDLLPLQSQGSLRQDLRDYLTLQLVAREAIPHFEIVYAALRQAKRLETKIWQEAVAAFKNNGNQDVTQLLITSLNQMFEAANAGMFLSRVHPPIMIFLFLIALAALGGFLVGYATADSDGSHFIYTYSYALLMALTIFIIINLELPRVGMIRLEAFDSFLIQVRDSWAVK